MLRIGEKLMSLRRKRHWETDQRVQRGGQTLPDVLPMEKAIVRIPLLFLF